MANTEKPPAPSTPAPPPEPTRSSPLALILPVAILTVIAAGTGGLFGAILLPQAHAPAPAESKAEHPSKGADHGLVPGASLKTLAPITTNLAGQKSTSENHLDVVTLLKEAARDRKGLPEAIHHLSTAIEEKNRVSYTGQSFRASDVASLHRVMLAR